tara:strand:+ start:953 stop:2542 length:1590 start_codon:yes stop_codon:yes gene_type:complete
MPMPRISPKSLLLGSGVILCLLWLLMTLISRGIPVDWLPQSWQVGFAYEVDNDAMPTGSFLVGQILASLGLVAVIYQLRNAKLPSVAGVILGFSLLMRLIAVPGEPIHESDFYRYLWDGHSAAHGINPYRFEPGALWLKEEGVTEPFEDSATGVIWNAREFSEKEDKLLERLASIRNESPVWFSRVSHQAVSTVYPPVAQSVFWLAATISPWSAVGLKGILLLFDLGIVVVLIALLKRLGKNPVWAVLYAWNPLVIKEFTNSLHYDAVPVFFCLLGLWIALSNLLPWKRAVMIGLVLGLGFLAKYFAILLLPVLLMAPFSKQASVSLRIRNAVCGSSVYLGVVAFVLVIVAGFLPFVLWDDAGMERVFSGLSTYGAYWQYNPGVFAVARQVFGWLGDTEAFRHAGLFCGVLLATVVIWQSFSKGSEPDVVAGKCCLVIGALFVLSPTAFPWYLCWVFAFAPIRPRWSWLIFGALWSLNYLDFKTVEVAPLAHAKLGGFYVLSGGLWLLLMVLWVVEYMRRKSRLPWAEN